MTYEILFPFQASPNGVTVKQYLVGDIITPTHIIERQQLDIAVQKGDACHWIPKSVENRIDKVKRAPKRK